MVTVGAAPSTLTSVVAVVALPQASVTSTLAVTSPHEPESDGAPSVNVRHSSTTETARATAAVASARVANQGTLTASST